MPATKDIEAGRRVGPSCSIGGSAGVEAGGRVGSGVC